jgi:hypothetical protein
LLEKKVRKLNIEIDMIQKVRAVRDDSSHWYVIPEEQAEAFYHDIDTSRSLKFLDFDERWGKYRTGGDVNNVQLYADLDEQP